MHPQRNSPAAPAIAPAMALSTAPAEEPASGETSATRERRRQAQEEASLAPLAARIAAGDRDAFAAFYDLTAARAYGVAFHLCGEQSAAEASIEAAYLSIWRDPAQLVTPGMLPSLLRRVREAALSHLPPPTGQVPDLLAITRRQSDIHHALKRLSDKQRTVLAATFAAGAGHNEASARLGTTVNAVGRLLRAAVRQLV